MHTDGNYPAEKPPGSLDIPLPWGTGDDEYLALLRDALPTVFASKPDIVFHVAGGDVFHDDQTGGLRLSKAGARQRDRLVLGACRAARVPTVIVPAGGYSRQLEDLVSIHGATFDEARSLLTSVAR
jgi:acetoin utilization deacetylase AcuC-like enzyme